MNNEYEYAKGNLRAYFLENTGRVLTSDELHEVFGLPEWENCVYELRDKEGYRILTCHDRNNLNSGEYLLETYKPLPAFSPELSEKARALAFANDDFYCYMCGASAGDTHLYDSTRSIRMYVEYIIGKSMGGTDDPSNLRALCSNCNEGASNATLMRPDLKKLMIKVRRATIGDQLEILKWLIQKFPGQTKEYLP
jgi:hypothetical protein